MSLANLEVFNDYAYTSFVESIAQQIDLFNAATQGGLVLSQAANQGDFSDRAIYGFMAGMVRRRNAYGSGSVSPIDLSMLLDTSVKVAAGTPPVNINPSWWSWIQRSPEEAGVVVGNQLAQQSMADRLNVSIKALVAALANDGTNIYDGTGGTTTLAGLNLTASKMGDRSAALKCWVLHSKSAFDIYGAALANSNRLFNFGDVQVVQDGFGRPLVISDAPDLIYSGGTRYHILGLVPGASIVEDNGDFLPNIDTRNGFESIVRTYQAEWTYNVGLKGFAWDKTNGGKSPNDAALGTGTNWDRYATSNKDLAGVMGNFQ